MYILPFANHTCCLQGSPNTDNSSFVCSVPHPRVVTAVLCGQLWCDSKPSLAFPKPWTVGFMSMAAWGPVLAVTEGLGCHSPCWTCASKPCFVRVCVHRFVCDREGLHAASHHHRHSVYKSHRGALAPKEGHGSRRVLQETPPCHQRATPLMVFLGGCFFWFWLGFVVVLFWQQLQVEGGL